MKQITLGRKIILLVILVLALSFIGCDHNRSYILAPNMSVVADKEENEISKYMDKFERALSEKNYEEAKKSLDTALYMGTKNLDTYKRAKDGYMKNKRFDDAFNVIRIAIGNDVDTVNMQKELENIKKNFDVVNMSFTINKGERFVLPERTKLNINGEGIEGKITWENPPVDTNRIGNTVYVGGIDEYGRMVKLNLKVEDIVINKATGFVRGLYYKDGSMYIKFDEVEFYRGDRALEEAKKDKSDCLIYENGQWGLVDDCYIRNIGGNVTRDIKVRRDALIYVCKFRDDKRDQFDSGGTTMSTNYEEFPDMLNKVKRFLCYVDLVNNEAVSIKEQYLP